GGAGGGDRGERVAVGAEGDLADLVRMAGQHPDATPSGHIPKADGAIGAGGGEPAPVRVEGDRADAIRMPVERREQPSVRRLPEAEVVVILQAARREHPAVT